MTGRITFSELEKQLGIEGSVHRSQSSLDEWYISLRNTPIDTLSVDDICVAVRQRLYLPHIVPEAANRLSLNPLAGDNYDGELIVSLAGLPSQFWAEHLELVASLRPLVASALGQMDDEDSRNDAVRLLSTLTGK